MDTRDFASVAIDALGGTLAVAKLFGVSEQVVSNWRARGLPPETYAVLAPLLSKRGYDASPVMFRQRIAVRKMVARRNGKGRRA